MAEPDPMITKFRESISELDRLEGNADTTESLLKKLELQTKLEELRVLRQSTWFNRHFTPVTATVYAAIIAAVSGIAGAYIQKVSYPQFFRTQVAQAALSIQDDAAMAKKLLILRDARLLIIDEEAAKKLQKIADSKAH